MRSPLRTAVALLALICTVPAPAADLSAEFRNPPPSARPWVYWYFMDGNMTREGLTADLEAMKRAGIGGAIFLEVDVGIPRGPVRFMSPPWRSLFAHAVREADRLGIEIALGAGPGWCGTGGPWVKPEQSMQHLVASETRVTGPAAWDAVLPRPQPRAPFFGEGTLTPELAREWREYYRDEAVLAFPTPPNDYRIPDVNEKALYYRAPFSSQPGVKPFLPAPAGFAPAPVGSTVDPSAIVDLTARMAPDGRLAWSVPPGNWTILRLGRTSTGQVTRPAPLPGLGFESDKFDRAALDAHFDAFEGTLLRDVGRIGSPGRGLTTLHFDSWEMSSQNWTGRFRQEFRRRRGYDPLRYLPAMSGVVVGSAELSERFLWDLRQTAQELVIGNHARRLRELGRSRGLKLSIEPYDLDPCSDLELGAEADVPMCEFWARGLGYNTEFSCFEAVSIAHTMGRKVVGAEAFTSGDGEAWRLYPGAMKAQADWALCTGINRITFHRYQHQPWLDRWPGMTMGPYGVHWERTQTWWGMVPAFHRYLSRCQALLRRGLAVADILYLAPEGAPHVFRAPASATQGELPDRRGYNFDGCAPGALIARATVRNGRIAFPDGMSYGVLVLPRFDTMTPALLRKIAALVDAGATVIGTPPRKSPSLSGYPACDAEVARLAARLWSPGGGRRAICDRSPGSGSPPARPLSHARWIWRAEGNPAASAPVGARMFTRRFTIDAGCEVRSARIAITADNDFALRVNGRMVGSGTDFHRVSVFDAAPVLRPGANTIAVRATNDGDAPNPAGLIAELTVTFRRGDPLIVPTDRRWTTALASGAAPGPALELGPPEMGPWNVDPDPGAADIYPPYEVATDALRRMGVRPDFESDGSVRYIHRRDGATDLYFVSNVLAAKQTTVCAFRLTGRRPELWDPVTGEQRDLPDYRPESGRTRVTLRFEPAQSFFVVFRKPARKPVRGARNFADVRPAGTLTGAWTVAFDPKWGGPASVTFSSLVDWTRRTEPGIRCYSGVATYRKTFDAGSICTRGRRAFLDIGAFHHMVRVRLNGRDLGVVWCEPHRVAIPDGLLRMRGNRLEIEVANLWPNRLIGDAGLPADRRVTWTTVSPYRADSPLISSGLLGPVRLMVSGTGR